MNDILKRIQTPEDLRRLPPYQLPLIAEDIREKILETTSQNGGHVASNLGVVELTLALHYVFQTPEDKLIWDVGHQCYAHKLLTGRQETFSTLRKPGGLSGFCTREESVYDCFTTGHSSNSISLALGMAKARDQRRGTENIVAVIGDGALTGGMAFEAMNQAGDQPTRLIVVLNDNGMSIGGNVGALSRKMAALRAGKIYNDAKDKISDFLLRIPGAGKYIVRFIRGFKHILKSAIVPGMIFENFGFTYLGPIDGHDVNALVEILRRAATMDKPVLVHVKTVKGKGFAPAEERPDTFHGIGSFDPESGEPAKGDGRPTYTDIFGLTLAELGNQHQDLVAVTAAMSNGTGLHYFENRFPDRFFDVGIAEQHALSFCAGLANGGQRPVAAIYSSFLQRGYDQIMEDIGLQKLPVVLAVDRAGLVGDDGYSHQGIYDLTYLRSVPNLTVMAPGDGRELRLMLCAAVNAHGPVALRYPRGAAAILPTLPPPIQLGKSVTLRDGNDLVFFAIGSMVLPCLQAAEMLVHFGIEARVINARFVAPLDREALFQAVKECHGRLVTAEENIISGGFGAACAEALSSSGLTYDQLFAALPKGFYPQGAVAQQLENCGLSSTSLAGRALMRWFPERSKDHGPK